MVVVGADVHKRTHTFVVDEVGKGLGQLTVSADAKGHDKAMCWSDGELGEDLAWGIEDCRHLSARLGTDLLDAGQAVVRVPPKLMAERRRVARTRAKSDPIDALMVARVVLREPDPPGATHRNRIDPTIDPAPKSLERATTRAQPTELLDSRTGVDARLAPELLPDILFNILTNNTSSPAATGLAAAA